MSGREDDIAFVASQGWILSEHLVGGGWRQTRITRAYLGQLSDEALQEWVAKARETEREFEAHRRQFMEEVKRRGDDDK